MQFKKIKLKDIADINMGQSPSGSSYNNNGRGIPFLQGNKTFGFLYPIIDTWTTEPKKIGKKNSVLMSVRAPVGDLNIANKDICIGRGLCSIEMKNGNNQYLYYLLKNSIKKIKMKSTGTVFDSINRKELENIEILDFNKLQQKKISKVLFDIDKKIELNIQTNDNLYEIIKTQYDKFINDIDEYELVKLKDIVNVSSGKRPKIKGNEFDIPLIGASGVMAYTDNYNFNEDILIIGRVGTLGVVQRYFHKIWASDNTLTIKTEYSSAVECYLKTVDYISLNRGSTQPLITQNDISNLKMKFNKVKFEEFEKEIRPLRDKIYKNELQNKTLEQLRDTLLPELMNGEIDLDKIKI